MTNLSKIIIDPQKIQRDENFNGGLMNFATACYTLYSEDILDTFTLFTGIYFH